MRFLGQPTTDGIIIQQLPGEAHCDGGVAALGGAGGSNLGVAGSANGGSVCEGAVNATTPACLTGAGGDANGGNAAAGGAGGTGSGGVGGAGGLAFGGDGGLGGVACFEPSSGNTNAGAGEQC